MKNYRVHATHWLIPTQATRRGAGLRAADVDAGAPPRVWAGAGAEACSPCRAPHAEAWTSGRRRLCGNQNFTARSC